MSRRSQARISAALFLLVLLAGCQQENQADGPEGPALPESSTPTAPDARSLESQQEVAPVATATAPSLAAPTQPGKTATTPSGLSYETLQEGDGPQAKPGDRVTVHYTGTFENGQKFDSSRDRDEPWTFEVGSPLAVKGFNEGVAGMKVGERRRLTVSPQIGYGALGTFAEAAPGVAENSDGSMQSGKRPEVPPNTTLVFDVELISIP